MKQNPRFDMVWLRLGESPFLGDKFRWRISRMLRWILHDFAMYWIAHVKVRMETCSVTLLTNTVFLVRQLVLYIPYAALH